MKANELRIGNIVTHDDYSGEIFEVISILPNPDMRNSYMIDTRGGKNGTWVNDISLVNPVPLTIKWLLKFGFIQDLEEDVSYYAYAENCPYDRIEFNYLRDCWVLRDNEGMYYEGPQYVHQLQNLYFAMTGEELEIVKRPRQHVPGSTLN